MNNYLICYVDTDGSNRYAICENSYYINENNEFDVAAYAADNRLSAACITNVFDTKDNLIDKSRSEQERFEDMCENYGFSRDNYKAPVNDTCTGENFLLVGFLPQNTKYKALLRNVRTGRYTKTTVEYVKRRI